MKNPYELKGKNLPILTYPDPILKQVATEVIEFNSELISLADNMLFTMYHAPGIGLAAPQVGLSKRIFVIDVDFDREEEGGQTTLSNFNPRIFINPKIIEQDGQTIYQEGCLSVPEIYEDVQRAQKVIVQYQDLTGTTHELNAEGLLAICIQHELDHLNGIVFIERLSLLKKKLFKKKLMKDKMR